MRINLVLAMLVLSLAPSAIAYVQPEGPSQPSNLALTDASTIARKFGTVRPKTGAFSLHNPGAVRITAQPDTTCYAVRSYVHEREAPRSDSTNLVDYSTCQPSSKYEVREASPQ